MAKRSIVVLGPSLESRGGISSVLLTYRTAGFFERWPILFLSTTETEKSLLRKLTIGLHAFCCFVGLLLARRVDLVHAHVAVGVSFWRKSVFLLLARAFCVPTIFHLHSGELLDYHQKGSRFRQKFITWLLDGSTAIAVLSTQWRESIARITQNRNIWILYNPIIVGPRPSSDIRENRRLLFLGELCRRKGIDDFIEAVDRLSKTFSDLTACCAGNGEVERIREKVSFLSLRSIVEVPGWIDSDTRRRLLAESTCLVLPSYREGLPMSILEAMAAELPTVSTTTGGIPDEITDGVEGFLVDPGQIDAMTDRIATLLTDDSLRLAMGKAARAKVEKVFSAEAALKSLDALYHALLDR